MRRPKLLTPPLIWAPCLQSKLVASDEMSGRAFIESFEDTPVVLMSEGGDTDDVMRAVTLGAVDFLDKPLSVLKLKNIWQHSVRKMMQRTSLYDRYTGPAASEPGPGAHVSQQPSISNCLPSSMTAPIALGPTAIRKCPSDKGMPHRSSVDSPGTPSAGDAELADAISAGSVRLTTDNGPSMLSFMGYEQSVGAGAGGDDVSMHQVGAESLDAVDSGVVSKVQGQTASALRPSLSSKPTSFGPMVPASQWPQLAPGCVWGTPVGGPLPPPLTQSTAPTWTPMPIICQQPIPAPTARDSPVSVLLKSRPTSDVAPSHVSLPSTAPDAVPATAASDAALPAGFLTACLAKKEGGPLGLKLRKSDSLLNLINTTLSTPREGAVGEVARSL